MSWLALEKVFEAVVMRWHELVGSEWLAEELLVKAPRAAIHAINDP